MVHGIRGPATVTVLVQKIMINQVPKVICAACGESIFFCRAVGRDYIGANVRAEDFVPIGDHTAPMDSDSMICPFCKQPFVVPNGVGGIILKLEGESWWPHPPF